MAKFVLRFFFDYGAGGCLWAGDAATCERFDVGPLDATFVGLDGSVSREPLLPLSTTALAKMSELDFLYSGYLNPKSPSDPSLWTQTLCNRFNEGVDELLLLFRAELGHEFEILDQQYRMAEDEGLGDCLTANPEFAAMDTVTKPSVG